MSSNNNIVPMKILQIKLNFKKNNKTTLNPDKKNFHNKYTVNFIIKKLMIKILKKRINKVFSLTMV